MNDYTFVAFAIAIGLTIFTMVVVSGLTDSAVIVAAAATLMFVGFLAFAYWNARPITPKKK